MKAHAQNDRIDLSAIDAAAGGADTAFVFIGAQSFPAPGQLRYSHDTGQTIVEADRDGDGTADMQIALGGTLNLVAGGFIL